MKLNEKTLNVLKNYADLNQNILIQAGNRLKTMTSAKNVFAFSEVPDAFPCDVPIYNLPEFLNCLKLFDDPELEFSDTHVDIKDAGSSSIRYFYAEPSIISKVPDRSELPDSPDVSFNLSWANLERVLKATSVLSVGTVSILSVTKNGSSKIVLRAHDAANASSNKFDVEVGENTTGKEFQADFKAEVFKLIPQDYEVRLLFKGISEFRNVANGNKYFVGFSVSKAP